MCLLSLLVFLRISPVLSGLESISAETGAAGSENASLSDSSSGISRRIVGGVKADADAWPWMAALTEPGLGSDYVNQFCGGALIHPNWILTAAHCVKDDWGQVLNVRRIEAVLGTNDLKYGSGEHFAVKQIIVHPLYGDGDDATPDSDIALLELETSADRYPTLGVCTGSDTLAGKNSIVMGWGSTRGWENLYRVADPWILRQVTLPVVSNAECAAAFAAQGYTGRDYTVDSSMLCAGDIRGGKDSCQGDSGGPLTVQEDGIWKLAGMVSWGVGRYCAEPGVYGVYTRVSEFIDFIVSHTGIRLFPASPALTLSTSGTEISLSWEAVSGAEGYFLYFAPWPDMEPVTEVDMGLVRILSGQLPSGSAYYAAVKAYNSGSSGSLSNIVFFVFIEDASSSALTIRTEDDAKDISWTPPDDSVSCRLHHAPYPEIYLTESKDMGTQRQISASAVGSSSFYILLESLNLQGSAQYSNVMGVIDISEWQNR